MRIALISDLHANDVALTAVLQHAEDEGVDQIVCLGDVATMGPSPVAVLEKIRKLDCPCILGNHDEFMLDPKLVYSYTDVREVIEAVDWARDQLSDDHFAFIRDFVDALEIDLGGDAMLFVYHGSPRSNMEDLLATTPTDELAEMLDGGEAAVLAGGHTHIQMLRQHRGMLIVNPGSVGAPFKEAHDVGAPTILPHAEYALVEASDSSVNVSLRRVALAREALRDAVSDWDVALRDQLLESYA